MIQFFWKVEDMEIELQSKAAGDDDVMMALNKKVEEWKVNVQFLFSWYSSLLMFLSVTFNEAGY